jgi:hypothetical protein
MNTLDYMDAKRMHICEECYEKSVANPTYTANPKGVEFIYKVILK